MTHTIGKGDEGWCAERRAEVETYLRREGLEHGRIGDGPAWHVAPYVSVWAVESPTNPGWVGWWAICGDLPTDYVTSSGAKHPRDAVRSIVKNWLELIPYLERGEEHPTLRLGAGETAAELAPLLKSRAKLLTQWLDDESVWPRP